MVFSFSKNGALGIILLILPFSVAISQAGAENLAGKGETILQADLITGLNPEGLMLTVGGYHRKYGERFAEGVPTSYLQGGVAVGVSPAYGQASAHIEWQPERFATLRLQYDFYSFFGASGALLSFPSGDARFGKNETDALEGKEETGTGHRLLLQPTLAAKAGPVILRNQTDLAYYRFDGEGPYFLEWEYNTLLRDDDLVVANRTQVLLKPWQGGEAGELLYVGPYYEVVHAEDASLTRQRLGLVAYLVPVAEVWGLRKPRLYGQTGVNLQDPNRRNEMYLILGAGFDL